MKKSITTVLALIATIVFSGSLFAGVESLRGSQPLTDMSNSPDVKKQEVVKGGFDRSYKIQPPLIPHKIDKEEINLKVNTCLKCHSEKTYKEKKAPKVGDSHFINSQGKKLSKVSTRRYFCNQCHATQLDAKPLVENTFVGAK